MLQNANCFESIIAQSLNMYKEKLGEFECKVRVTASAKKDLVDQKFLFDHIRLPFVGALRLVFSEYLDKTLSQDENFIFALVEVLGGTINCNVGLLKSKLPLVEECKNGILMLSLLYLFNNLNYTQNSNHCADLHLGQLIDTIEGRGEILKSNRFYRPLFLRTLTPSNRNSNAGYANNRGSFRGDRFEVKRPRNVSPVPCAHVPKPWMDDRSLQSSPVSQASPVTASSEPRSPVGSVTRASESLAANRIQPRVCEQNWDIQAQVSMDVEDEDQGTEDESNPCLDDPIGVVQLD